ncbi:MAG: class I SAM-dependent methyltransferase [Promethearchaeota archaeon]
MIEIAREKSKENLIENLKFKACTLEKLALPEGSQDYVISNFVLSELKPLEQQIFLRKA